MEKKCYRRKLTERERGGKREKEGENKKSKQIGNRRERVEEDERNG